MTANKPFDADAGDEGQYRRLVNAITDYGIYMLDPDGVITSWNRGAERFKGYRAAEIIGQSYACFFTEEDRAGGKPQSALALATATGRSEVEGWRVRKDGTRFWAHAVVDRILDDDGAVIGFAKITRDITEKREAALALEQANEKLLQSQKMEAVGQLTGGIAHDFNNMLTGITGSLELMQKRVEQGRIQDLDRYIVAAQGAARRAAALTHRLLAFSRQQTLAPRPTDVSRLVTGMEELIRRTMGPAIMVESVGAGGLWTTNIDPNQLENALLNLCLNARDAMPRGGRLTIETANKWLDERGAAERDLTPGQYVSLCVSDAGSGMAPDVVKRAFDPFFTTKPLGSGTGLGLSMIYGFVRQSNGQARIYSEVGQGTMVCLYLPRHYGEADEADAPAQSDAPRAEAGETVLIVDDEATIRMLVADILEECGYASIEAETGAEGLKLLQSDARIDLLVTDIGLPGGMNGRQMAEAARVTRPDLKVLFITGYAENAVIAGGIVLPGTHVLTKPFTVDDLVHRVRAIITG
ncbi:PAS domain S-box protein [Sphingosinicellaceae bacterium]|nr:PAS domain S-box protein [Sphingosinicellaceae bacterium]